MRTISFKKLLSLLTALTVVTTASINIVACGNNEDKNKQINTKNKANAKYTYYGVNDKYYYSKQEALDDQIQRNVKTTSENDFLKDITLGEQSYQTLDQMYDAIAQNYQISPLLTKKDPNNYVIDAMGQLSANVITDGLETSLVYRDINGQAIDSKDNDKTKALEKAQQSYLSQIEKKYIVDDQYFDNKDDILSYYQNKYQTKNQLEKSDCYVISNSCVEESELKAILERSLNFKFQYNNEWIEQNQMDDLSKIKLTYEDESKIKKFSKSPGIFLVEKNDQAKGVLTGSTVFQAPEEIADIVHNKFYWDLTTDSDSIGDVFEGFFVGIYSGIKMTIKNLSFRYNKIDTFDEYIKLYESYEKMGNINKEEKESLDLAKSFVNDVNLYKSFFYHNMEKEYSTIQNLIQKYEIVGDFNEIVFNLNYINSIDYTIKEKIMFYQLSELFRNSNITRQDSKMLNSIWYNLLLDFDSSKKWESLVNSFSNYDVTYMFEYLVNPSAIATLEKHMLNSDYKNLVLSINDYFLEAKATSSQLSNDFNTIYESFTDKLNKISPPKENVYNNKLTEFFEKVESKFASVSHAIAQNTPILDMLLATIDSFSFTTSYTYRLRIPDTNVELMYNIKKMAWENDDFDPASFFKVFDIKKPSNSAKYLYAGRYFSSLEEAEKSLKLDIIEQQIKSEQVSYYSDYNPNINNTNKDALINELITQLKQKPQEKYLDHFGESFETSDKALDSMVAHLEKQDFRSIYIYRYGSSENEVFYNSDLEQLQKKALNELKIATKTVLWTDLLSTRDFDQLEGITKVSYNIFQANINGKLYYFKSNTQAISCVMKMKNFKNLITKIAVKTYVYKNQTFKNKEDLEDYILSNIKTYSASNVKEVQNHVGY